MAPEPRVVVAPEHSAVWRAVIPMLVMTSVALGSAAVTGDGGRALVTPFLLVWGALRAGYWQWRLGRRVVADDGVTLSVRGRGTRTRSVAWADVAELRLVAGDRFPEWSRIATFPTLVAVAKSRREPVELGELLLRTKPAVSAARPSLAEAALPHGVPFGD